MIDLQDLLRMVRRGWLTVLCVAFATIGIAAIYVIQAPRVYVASTTLYVTTSASGSVEDLDRTSTFASRAATTFTAVVDSPTVLQPVSAALGGQLSVSELASAVQAVHPEDTTLVSINAYDTDPSRAALIANSVAATAAQEIPRLQQGPLGSLVRLQQTNQAEVPTLAVSPNVRNILQIGVILGLVAGIATTILRQTFDTRILRRADIQKITDAPVLAEIPSGFGVSDGLVARDAPTGPAGEAFRVLRTNLGFVENWSRRSIVITSMVSNSSSRTPVAANIAWTLAQSNNRVVLVDADLRSPGGNLRSFPGEGSGGLSEVLTGKVELHNVVHEPLQTALHVLHSGNTSMNPADLLSTSTMSRLLDNLERSYDFVIIDAPPIDSVPDAAILAGLAGGTLLVLPLAKARQSDVSRAVDALAAVRVKPAGLVLTASQSKKRKETPRGRGTQQVERNGLVNEQSIRATELNANLDSPTLRQRPVSHPNAPDGDRSVQTFVPSPVARQTGQNGARRLQASEYSGTTPREGDWH